MAYNGAMLKKIFWWLLVAAGIFGILATIAALFVTNGVNIGTVLPGISGAALLAYGVFRLVHKGPLFRSKALRIVVTAVICLGLALFVFVEALIISAACAPEPEEEADVVVVLGCGIFPDGHLSLSLKSRLDAALDYLEAHPDTLCIVTGGQGGNEPRPEANAMKDYLVMNGINPGRIYTDTTSTSTEENLANALSIMRGLGIEDGLIAIATNDYHVYRAVMLAKDFGLSAFGLPAKTPLLVRLPSYMRECLAVINTFVFHVGSGNRFLENF
jgi:uncharacterized SAM-binding protein YcdF (DUF218 family)